MNILTINVYSMSKRKLIQDIGQGRTKNWEKLRPIGLKGTNSRALDP